MKGTLLFVTLLLTLFPATVRAQNSQTDQDAKRQSRRATQEALRKPDGVHEAAKLNGGFVDLSRSYEYGWLMFTDLQAIAGDSDIAIIGTPVSSTEKTVNDGRDIVTEYKVQVQEPIQGNAKQDEVVEVELPGGSVKFSDGTSAVMKMDNYPRLEVGHRYVLYLVRNGVPNPSKAFHPTAGPRGIYELKENGKVHPFAPVQLTKAADENDDVLEFTEKVRFNAKYQKKQN